MMGCMELHGQQAPARQPRAEPGLWRFVVLAVAADGCAVLCGLVAVVQGDVSRIVTAFDLVAWPPVMLIWGPLVAVGALAGDFAATRILRGVSLLRALPLVVLAAVLATMATGRAAGLAGLPAGLGAGVGAMLACRWLATRYPSWVA